MARRDWPGSSSWSWIRSGSGIGTRCGRRTNGGAGQPYRNGYYERDFVTRFGTLRLRVARTREKSFLPRGIERFQRRAEEVAMLIREAFLRGISTRQAGRVVAVLTGEGVSATTVSQLTRDLDQAVREFHEARAPRRVCLLVLGRSESAGAPSGGAPASPDAGGLRSAARRHAPLAGVSAQPRGESGDWEGLLQDLYRRGLEGKHLGLIVTDGCPGLAAARRDGEARFLRERGGFALGSTAEIAVSEDHLIVAQRVTLHPGDVPALVPLGEEVEPRTGAYPGKALADAGFYSNENVRDLEERGIEVYVPDPNLARELNTGKRARTIGRNRVRSPELKAMRKKLRSPAGRRVYGRRKALVEPVFGVLKQQRGMRQFRTRGPVKVAAEFTLAALAYNLTRLFGRRLAL